MNKDDLRIAEPCHADWNAMKRGDKSRFCGDCKKVVHDLSKLTRAEAAKLLATQATPRSRADGPSLCVRALHDELGQVAFLDSFHLSRPADAPVPVASLLRKTAKRVATAALLAFPLSLTACMGAMQPPPPPPPPPPPTAPAPLETVDAGAPMGSAVAPSEASKPALPLAK